MVDIAKERRKKYVKYLKLFNLYDHFYPKESFEMEWSNVFGITYFLDVKYKKSSIDATGL